MGWFGGGSHLCPTIRCWDATSHGVSGDA
jgi:hypothetical protein